MLFLRRTSLLLATMVVLLHTVIAHEHISDMSDVEHFTSHKNPASVFDTITLSFHVDSGSGHLENFVEQGIDDVGHNHFVNSGAEYVIIHSTADTYSTARPGFIADSYIRQSRNLRAPPRKLI